MFDKQSCLSQILVKTWYVDHDVYLLLYPTNLTEMNLTKTLQRKLKFEIKNLPLTDEQKRITWFTCVGTHSKKIKNSCRSLITGIPSFSVDVVKFCTNIRSKLIRL